MLTTYKENNYTINIEKCYGLQNDAEKFMSATPFTIVIFDKSVRAYRPLSAADDITNIFDFRRHYSGKTFITFPITTDMGGLKVVSDEGEGAIGVITISKRYIRAKFHELKIAKTQDVYDKALSMVKGFLFNSSKALLENYYYHVVIIHGEEKQDMGNIFANNLGSLREYIEMNVHATDPSLKKIIDSIG